MIISKNKEIHKFLNQKNFKKIFILSGKNSYFKSGANKIFDNLLVEKKTMFYFKKSFYPDIKELKVIIEKIDLFNPDLVIGIGGGCVIDYVKIARVIKDNINLATQILDSSFKIKKKNYELLAIPTTAGSGAEVTANAVIYINKKKFSIEGSELKPDFFFLIPELIIGASKKIKASAGFDAIAQSIESLISIKSNLTSVKFAKESLKISLNNFNNYVNNPTLQNTFNMSLAANLSGKAISISKTTVPHALSYPFTAYYNVSHGHAVSLTLNDCLAFNYKKMNFSKSKFNLKKRFDIIFKLAKVKNITELTKFLSHLKDQTGLSSNFRSLGVDLDKDYNKILSGVNLQRLKNNPIELKKNDLLEILKIDR